MEHWNYLQGALPSFISCLDINGSNVKRGFVSQEVFITAKGLLGREGKKNKTQEACQAIVFLRRRPIAIVHVGGSFIPV